MKFAAINGTSIHYKLENSGLGKPLIVFSNSLATDFRIWQDCVDDLSADYSILRYDKRGHGLSGMGHPPYEISDHVNDLVALMDHLNLSGAVVVGLSVGGLIAVIFAVLAYPHIGFSFGLDEIIVPLVKSLKPRFPCATSIALHTVGVSIVSRSLKSDSVILNYSIFWSAFLNKKE